MNNKALRRIRLNYNGEVTLEVGEGDWYATYMAYALEHGILVGSDAQGTFNPTSNIQRCGASALWYLMRPIELVHTT